MPPPPTTPPDQGESHIRDRGDACPGALRLHPAADGGLARLRLPAGLLTGRQLWALSVAAERLGDGSLSITSRGNVELRGLADGCGPALAELLREAGLLPSDTHERVRNIVASPLAGLDGYGGRGGRRGHGGSDEHGGRGGHCGRGSVDVRSWARELDALLCASERAAELSGRFLFALDDGRCDVAGLGADVTLVALLADGTGRRDGPEDGPGDGSEDGPGDRPEDGPEDGSEDGPGDRPEDGPEDGSEDGPGDGPEDGRVELRIGRHAFRVRTADAARAALAAAEAFLAAAAEAGTGAWRVRELPEGQDIAVGAELERAGVAATPCPRTSGTRRSAPEPGSEPAVDGPSGPGAGPLPGIVEGPGGWAVSVLAPLGRLTVAQARELLPAPADEVRLTPWRGAVVPGFADRGAARARLDALRRAGFVTGTGSPWYGVGACTGRPGCARSLADVRADVRACLQGGAAAGVPAGAAPGPGGLPVYWSGCERRCGRPQGDHVDVVATGDGTYRVTARGTSVPVPSSAELGDTIATARIRATK
ncbi:hypothetical protein OTC26_016170 [Streptomyces tirandamycinicus]|uniref:hypothetical protein n=1 Tax=Streptomyces tirandamycinicus TaxID=2174846 RepID=UPI002D1E48DF|nr:hypothetical protein [Streptomyces tirandamycinicus]